MNSEVVSVQPQFVPVVQAVYPHVQADASVWEGMRSFLDGCPRDPGDSEEIRRVFEGLAQDAKTKPPMTPESRNQLRLAVMTEAACTFMLETLIGGHPATLAEVIHDVCGTERAPADDAAARVRELANGAGDRAWLEAQWRIAREEIARHRQADYWRVAAEFDFAFEFAPGQK